MGSDARNGVAGRRARLGQYLRAHSGGIWMLQLAFASLLCVAAAAAQPTAEPAAAAVDVSPHKLAARIEALEKLAAGALPQVPLDSLLSVSLDDDSSMVERDAAARLEHRRLVIALNRAERAQDKSEAELQQMRDEILAVELERKVLALPIEVRERLVQESDQDAPASPAPPASAPPPAETAKAAVETSADSTDTQPSPTVAQPAAPAGKGGSWLSGWVLIILAAVALLAVFACKDVVASLIGHVVLTVQHSFDVSHRVEIGGVEGKVTEMGPLSVRMLSSQQRTITVPNREFLSKHFTASPPSAILTPFHVDFYIHSQQDINRAKRIIRAAIQSTPGADPTEERSDILVGQLSMDGKVMVRLRAKVSVMGTRSQQEVASDLSERVLEHLRGDAGALASEPLKDFEPSASSTQ